MKIHSLPWVSIIITAYNAEKYLAESIQSVIDQKYLNAEIIVIDDGSTDKTMSIINIFSEQVTYYYQEHSGIATGWNHGVKKSHGKYLSFIDADDFWSERKLHFQVQLLENYPDIEISFGYAQEFFESEKNQKKKEPIQGISAGTMMIHKNRFLDVGYFNPEWRKSIFSDWYLRATEQGVV